jgi:Rne/Rng family ribonuclease
MAEQFQAEPDKKQKKHMGPKFKLIINTIFSQYTQIILQNNDELIQYYVLDHVSPESLNTVYRAKIISYNKTANSYFIQYGGHNQIGFLPCKESLMNNHGENNVGSYVTAQIRKMDRPGKCPFFTAKLSLMSENILLLPTEKISGKQGFLSHKITDQAERKNVIAKLAILQSSIKIIGRESAKNIPVNILKKEYVDLLERWNQISEIKENNIGVLYRPPTEEEIITYVRDIARVYPLQSICVDNEGLLGSINALKKTYQIKFHAKKEAFTLDSKVLSQIVQLTQSRSFRLPSGASISIDKAEAMTVIDINSSRHKYTNANNNILAVNLEASTKIFQLIELLELSGIIAIDYIDMASEAHILELEEYIRSLIMKSNTMIQIEFMNRFGVCVLTRHRKVSSLLDIVCQIDKSTTSIWSYCLTIKANYSLYLKLLQELCHAIQKQNSSDDYGTESSKYILLNAKEIDILFSAYTEEDWKILHDRNISGKIRGEK